MARVAVGGGGYGGGGGLTHGDDLSGGFRNRWNGEHNKDCVVHTASGRIRTITMWTTGKSLEPPSNDRKNRESLRTVRL
jgi:hypothetical protein